MKVRCPLYILLFLWLFSCGEEVAPPDPDLSGPGFYPLQVGNFWVYDMERIDFLALANDTSVFQLREIITDSIVTGAGQVTYLLNRETRLDPEGAWRADSLWTVRSGAQGLVITENNIPLVKLVFPVVAGQTWDGNSFNNRGNQTFEFREVSPSELPNDFQAAADSVDFIRTVISDIQSLITGTDRRSEVYGKGIGLVEKDYLVVSLCTNDCETSGDTLGGFVLSQRLIEFGEQ